jgi:hypothetical protein
MRYTNAHLMNHVHVQLHLYNCTCAHYPASISVHQSLTIYSYRHSDKTLSTLIMWPRILLYMNLLPTVHLGLAQPEIILSNYGKLRGKAVGDNQYADIVAYVMTSATNVGLLESKLVWRHLKV